MALRAAGQLLFWRHLVQAQRQTAIVRCCTCSRCVPTDFEIKRFQTRNTANASSRFGLRDAGMRRTFALPRPCDLGGTRERLRIEGPWGVD